jgi:DNA-binding LacI/PurR family transcriptional regulator
MERGLRIPDDLAVIAYNDETAAMAVVPLTAVCPPKLMLGESACELLLRKIGAAPGRRAATQHLSLLPELRIRSSCGALVAGQAGLHAG